MIPKSPSRIKNIPLAGRSAGQSKLVIPYYFLVQKFGLVFALKTLNFIAVGQPLRDVKRFVEEEGLGEGTLTLADACQGFEPPRITYNEPWKDTGRLIAVVDDTLDERGSWEENRRVLRDALKHGRESLLKSLLRLIRKVLRTHGIKAAVAILTHCQQRWRLALREATALSQEISQSDLKKLKQLVGIAKNLKKKYPRAHRVGLALPKLPYSFGLSHQDKRNLKSLLKLVNELRQRRFEIQCRLEMILLYEGLLGEHGSSGAVQALESEIHKVRGMLQTIQKSIESGLANSIQQQPKVNEIELLSHIDQTLELEGGDTVAGFFLRMAEQAGVTPKLVASAIRTRGLKLQNEHRTPADWIDCKPAEVTRSLMRCVRKVLGYTNDDVEINPDEPRTALDFMAQLSLTSPFVRNRLQHAIAAWIDQSKPYAEFPAMHGVSVMTARFLYCSPNDRSTWASLLRSNLQFAESDYADGYCMPNPFVAILLQVRFGAPIGAMRDYHRACAVACRSEKDLNIEPHLDRYRCPEMRLLAERVRDFNDCKQLLRAASDINAIRKLPCGNLALSRMDSRVADVFSTTLWEPAEQPAETIHYLHRRDSRFASALTRIFPIQTDLSDMLRYLQKDDSALKLVNELVSRDVLVEQEGRYRINATFANQPLDLPPNLVKATRGTLVGLSEQQFISELYKNDQLYCLLFFAVFDAHLRGQLSENQVPASIVECSRILT